jgi:hypothetical protein
MKVESGQPPASGDPKDSGRDGDQGTIGRLHPDGPDGHSVGVRRQLFFLLKLVDMSRQEDCLMSGRRNCAPIEVPSNR